MLPGHCASSSGRERPLFLVALLLSMLTACGGGGGSEGGSTSPPGGSGGSNPPPAPPSTPNPPPPPPSATEITLNPASITLQSDISGSLPESNIQVTITNPPEGNFYYQATIAGTAAQSVDAQLQSRTTGNIRINYWSPRATGSGSFSDTVRFRICSDNQCAQIIAERTVSVAVTITGSYESLTTFNVVPITNTLFEAQSVETTGRSLAIGLTVFDIPPDGLYVRFDELPAAGSRNVVSRARFRQTGPQSAEINVDLEAPESLDARTYNSDLQVFLCFDAACTRTVTGSPIATPLRYQIYASEGREFTSIELALGARSAAWDQASERLYVLQVSQAGTTLVSVDPATGITGTPVPVPDESTSIMISDDGQFAYVNSTYGGAVYRYRIPGLVHEDTIHLGGFLQAAHVAVAPGAPGTIAVQLLNSGVEAGIAIYDDLVKRSDDGGPAAWMGWGVTAESLYSVAISPTTRTFQTWAASPAGLTLGGSMPVPGDVSMDGPLALAADQIYATRTGAVYDPATQNFSRRLGTWCCGSVTVDSTLDRAFAFSGPVTSFEWSTGAEIATARSPSLSSSRDTPPIRWGSDGLALVTYDGRLLILKGSFVAP